MMEAARISETSIDIQLRIRQYIPEDSDLLNTVLVKFVQTFYEYLYHFFTETGGCKVVSKNLHFSIYLVSYCDLWQLGVSKPLCVLWCRIHAADGVLLI
jgi:hypothetical protein